MVKHAKTKPKRMHDKLDRNRRMVFVIVAVVIVALAGAGTFYYHTWVAPSRKVVLTVDNHAIQMDYFLKRVRMADTDPNQMLQQLAYELIIQTMAPQYGMAVSPSEIDTALKEEAASSKTEGLTDAGFREWYASRLKAVQLSDSEYREIKRTNLLADRFLEYLAKDIPTTAEQIHLYTIVTATSDDALKARSRIAAGENFAAVAREISLDDQTKLRGGDLGWIPRGVTPYDDVIFQLAAGQVSPPIAVDSSSTDTSQFIFFLVAEKDPDRVIDAKPLAVLRSRALYDFILQQIPEHVKYSYTPEDNEWVLEQLAIIGGP